MSRPNNPQPRGEPAISGILVVDKPHGISSMTCVAAVRRRAAGTRTGHAGTLDPLATGVLVLALGRATRSIDLIQATDKHYRTSIDLSAFTSTDDLEGERREVAVSDPPTREQVEAALSAFHGRFEQAPPAFSAVKVAGQRAYKLARADAAPALPPRPVVMHRLAVIRYEWPFVELYLECGKGLYVRSIARDLGRALGTGGHCTSIRRVAVGPFTLEMATPLDRLPDQLGPADVMPLESALALVRESPARSGQDSAS